MCRMSSKVELRYWPWKSEKGEIIKNGYMFYILKTETNNQYEYLSKNTNYILLKDRKENLLGMLTLKF